MTSLESISLTSLEGIPDILYKYRDWDNENHRRILTHNEIYLSSPDQFNDPFDCLLPYKYKEEDMTPENIYLKMRSVLKKQYPDMPEEEVERLSYERQSSGVFKDGRYWKEFYPKHKEDMTKNFGVFCTTPKKDNLLMWSHYANCHKGLCIGFDKSILMPNIFATIGPVIYAEEFPAFGLFDDDGKYETMNNHPLLELLYTKYRDWSYEKEYRFTKIRGAKQIININPLAIKVVVLGLNMEEKNKAIITDLVREKLSWVKLYQCSMNLEFFKLDMIPILIN